MCKSVNRLRKPWKITKNNKNKHDFTNLGSHLIKVMQIMFSCIFIVIFHGLGTLSHFCTLLFCFFMVLGLILYKCMRKHKWVYLSNLCFVMSSYISILLTSYISIQCLSSHPSHLSLSEQFYDQDYRTGTGYNTFSNIDKS